MIDLERSDHGSDQRHDRDHERVSLTPMQTFPTASTVLAEEAVLKIEVGSSEVSHSEAEALIEASPSEASVALIEASRLEAEAVALMGVSPSEVT